MRHHGAPATARREQPARANALATSAFDFNGAITAHNNEPISNCKSNLGKTRDMGVGVAENMLNLLLLTTSDLDGGSAGPGHVR